MSLTEGTWNVGKQQVTRDKSLMPTEIREKINYSGHATESMSCISTSSCISNSPWSFSMAASDVAVSSGVLLTHPIVTVAYLHAQAECSERRLFLMLRRQSTGMFSQQ
jgi:hypothetical protein